MLMIRSMAADSDPMRRLVSSVAFVGIATSLAVGLPAGAKPLPKAPKCPMFPKSYPTNKKVDGLPLLSNSDAIVASIGVERGLHPDFGSGTWDGFPIGIPFDVVSRKTK